MSIPYCLVRGMWKGGGLKRGDGALGRRGWACWLGESGEPMRQHHGHPRTPSLRAPHGMPAPPRQCARPRPHASATGRYAAHDHPTNLRWHARREWLAGASDHVTQLTICAGDSRRPVRPGSGRAAACEGEAGGEAREGGREGGRDGPCAALRIVRSGGGRSRGGRGGLGVGAGGHHIDVTDLERRGLVQHLDERRIDARRPRRWLLLGRHPRVVEQRCRLAVARSARVATMHARTKPRASAIASPCHSCRVNESVALRAEATMAASEHSSGSSKGSSAHSSTCAVTPTLHTSQPASYGSPTAVPLESASTSSHESTCVRGCESI